MTGEKATTLSQAPVTMSADATRVSAASAMRPSASSTQTIAIDVGSTAAVGNWITDAYYNSGNVAVVTSAINTSHVSDPAPQEVYQSQRWGKDLIYTIPKLTPNGAYTVALDFAEAFWSAAGDRIFNISINGTQVLTNFDIFASAGGKNIAIDKQFDGVADSTGNLVIALTATRDNATLAGIVLTSQSVSATPTPAPISGDALPWVYSELWSSVSPFRMTVAQQKSSGATVVPQTYMDALWSQGIAGNAPAAGIPIYVAKSTDPLETTSCSKYGGNCNAKNVKIHVPSYAKAQQDDDAHLTVIDTSAPSGPIEIDCWQAVISGSSLKCSWAGVYVLGGEGLDGGGEGIHGGMAVSTVFTTAAELTNGHIDHALGMDTICLNNPSIYPASTSATDASCNGGTNPPHYGNLMHLLWSKSQIADSSYSQICKVVLTALAKYGAYLDDTGNNGLQINTQNAFSYTADSATASLDPWPTIQTELNAAGDGKYQGWYSCLNRLQSSDFELLQIAQP